MAIKKKNIITNEDLVIDRVKSTRLSKTSQKRTSKADVEFNNNIQKLQKYKDKYIVLTNSSDIVSYFNYVKSNGMAAIDTETTGLRFFNDKVVGICLYTPGQKPCYIPTGHINPTTNEPIQDNADVDLIRQMFIDCQDVKWIFHNAPFDIPMIYGYCGIELKVYWDTMIGARMYRSDNKISHALKDLYFNYISKDDDIPIHFSDLFKSKTYEKLPVNVVYLYAAGDAYKTYKLYEWQLDFFGKPENKKMGSTLINIEFPNVQKAAIMSINGIKLDEDKRQKMSEKYHTILDKVYSNYVKELSKHSSKISKYNGKTKLDNPINPSSPAQLKTLLYDILEYTDEYGTDTGNKTLRRHNTNLCKAIIDYRKIYKLVNTYIDKLKDEVSPITCKVHTHFNPYGTATSRYSSDLPNMQNIPSKDFNLLLTGETINASEVRTLFVPEEGNVFISDDFSKQEPVAMAIISKDEELIKILNSGKDIYSGMASNMFNLPYEQCVEHNADGTVNKSGKAIRGRAKNLVLGINYGMGDKSLSLQIGCSIEDAREIKQKYLSTFNRVNEWSGELKQFVRDNNYVETYCGNRRYLEDYNLPNFVVINKTSSDNNNIYDCLFCEPRQISNSDIDNIVSELNSLYSKKDYKKLSFKKKEYSKTYKIIDNTIRIADAEREIVNSVIQGSAANATKYAIIKIDENKDFHRLGAKLISQIHDEVLIECPKKNANKVNRIVKTTMRNAMIELFGMPIEVDGDIMDCWNSSIEIEDENEED